MASSIYHQMIKSGSAQNAIMVFSDWYLSANDGDFEQSGIQIDDSVNVEEDYCYGSVQSATLNATLMNYDGNLSNVTWGRCELYIGVYYANGYCDFPASANCFVEFGSVPYYGNANGLYKNGTALITGQGACVALIAYKNSHLYAFFKNGGSYRCYDVLPGGTYTEKYENNFMKAKMVGKSYEWDGAYLNENLSDGTQRQWEYEPIGVFLVDKPMKVRERLIKIEDAHDYITNLDRDASGYLKTLTYPITFGQLFQTICRGNDLQENSIVFPHSTDSISACPVDSGNYTYRNIASWIAEYAHGFCRMTGDGKVEIDTVEFNVSTQNRIERYEIEVNGLEIAEYACPNPTKLILKNLSGITYTDGSGDEPYYVVGNPFWSDLTVFGISSIEISPMYPTTVQLVFGDPSYRCGMAFMIEENDLLDLSPFTVINRSIRWNGKAHICYSQTGNRHRVMPSSISTDDYTAAQASAATNGKLTLYDSDKNRRVELKDDALRFYDANGNQTGLYPSTYRGVSPVSKTSDMTIPVGMASDGKLYAKGVYYYSDVINFTSPTSLSLVGTITLPAGAKILTVGIHYHNSEPQEIMLTTTQGLCNLSAAQKPNILTGWLSTTVLTVATTIYVYGRYAASNSNGYSYFYVLLN